MLLALGRWSGSMDEPLVVDRPLVADAPVNVVAPSKTLHANYDYSVIPGGAFNEQELMRAVTTDPVVAEHYYGVDPSAMHPEVLDADRLAYVSYRVNNRVYWTLHKVRIRRGESVLTDGRTEIRARCGNCISTVPMMPTSADEPEATQLDALTATDSGHPMLVADANWPLALFSTLPADDPSDVKTTSQIGGSPFPYVSSGVPVVPVAGDPGDPPSTDPFDPGPDGVIHNPAGFIPPPLLSITDVPPPALMAPTLRAAPGDGPFAFDPPGSPLAPPSLAPGPFTAPINSTPVPEPATFVLLGGGIGVLIARRWRSITHFVRSS